jgi:hypothetical protein
MSDPTDTEPDSIARFASDLRMLRIAAGSPTLAHLQNTTGISRTVISEALAGKQLASPRTVDGLVRAFGGDPVEWLKRRDRLAPKLTIADGPVELAPGRPRRARRWLIGAVIAVAGIAVGAVGGSLVTSSAMGVQVHALEAKLKAAGPVNPRAQIVVRTGVDPAMTPCVNDAKVVASEDRTNDTRIQIVWSNKCYAGWARIARYDGKADGNEVKISIYPETAPNGPDRQDATEPGVQGAYTTLVVRPSPQTRLCAVGSITVDGQEISLGKPICS